MSLDLAGLKTNLKAVLDATKDDTVDAATSEENFINGLAMAIDTYTRTASLVYVTGLTAGSTPVTGAIDGGLL